MSYKPKSNLIFGNVNISDYGAFAFYCNIFDRPQRDVDTISVPGRNGDIVFDNGRYTNVDRVYILQVIGVAEAHRLISDLVSTVGYQKLIDEYDPDYYFVARLKEAPQITRFVGEAVEVSVTFDRQPQKWDALTEDVLLIDEEVASTSTPAYAEIEIPNLTKNIALPVIEIETDGAFNVIGINAVEFNRSTGTTVKESCRENGQVILGYYIPGEGRYEQVPAGKIIIDSERKAIYDAATNESRLPLINTHTTYPFAWPIIPAMIDAYHTNGFYVDADTASAGNKITIRIKSKVWDL